MSNPTDATDPAGQCCDGCDNTVNPLDSNDTRTSFNPTTVMVDQNNVIEPSCNDGCCSEEGEEMEKEAGNDCQHGCCAASVNQRDNDVLTCQEKCCSDADESTPKDDCQDTCYSGNKEVVEESCKEDCCSTENQNAAQDKAQDACCSKDNEKDAADNDSQHAACSGDNGKSDERRGVSACCEGRPTPCCDGMNIALCMMVSVLIAHSFMH